MVFFKKKSKLFLGLGILFVFASILLKSATGLSDIIGWLGLAFSGLAFIGLWNTNNTEGNDHEH
jgi:hypothetical protein